jgi:tripartite-type tricarboxylate transporter receptor subunit TctC
MDMNRQLFLWMILCGAFFGGLWPAASRSQTAYPTRTVRVVVPYPPGGGNDIIARAVADELTRRLAQQVIVENRPGGSTLIGTESVAKAPPDGYTVLVSSHTTFAIVPNLHLKLPYDVMRDFEPVSLLSAQPLVLVVHPSLPARDIRQLVALAKAQTGVLTYSTSGVGGGGHFCGELLNLMAGIGIRHIPYKGSAPALTDLVGGQVSMSFTSLAAAQSFARSGRLRLIAVTGAKRSPLATSVPTIAESGVPGYEMRGWNAMVAPRGTSKTVVDRLNTEIAATIQSPAVREHLAAQGYEAEASTPKQLSDTIKAELLRYGKLIGAVGMKAE